MIVHKFLRSGARGLFSDLIWPTPDPASGTALPGAWVEAQSGPLVVCHNGVHACLPEQLPYWIAQELWEVELDSEWLETQYAVVARRARLLRHIVAWDAPTQARFAQACVSRAEHAVAQAEQPTLAQEYLEQARSFSGENTAALASYASALAVSATAPAQEAMACFDAERAQQGRLLAQAVGLSP